MRTNPTVIVGAGLAGLIAAYAWPSAAIVDKMPEPSPGHRALLRFRSDAVARLTGIEFRPVTVRKGIWCGGEFVPPDIRLANWYALKCTGGALVSERSIWNIEPAQRYVAPDDFYEQLLAGVNGRVRWGEEVALDNPTGMSAFDPQRSDRSARSIVVSTAPLSETIGLLRDPPPLAFRRAPITVQRFTLDDDTDVHQTIYFPDPSLPLYRASITGRTLIVEHAGADVSPSDKEDARNVVEHAFGIVLNNAEVASTVTQQRFGKIAPIADDAARKHALFRLSHELGIYSLGRFATWRNILLDDVVQDIAVIKRLMRSGAYELRNTTT